MGMLSGEVVLVTGGGSGLGLGVAKTCLAEGAELAIMEIVPEKVERLKADFGDQVLVVQGDVTRISDVIACKEAIVKRFGRLSSLIGVQGIWDGNVPLKDIPLEKFDAAFDEVLHINIKGYLLTAKIFLDLLEKEQGTIVLTGSSGASYCADGGGALYTATKHAVLGVVRQLSYEFAPAVRVNGVAPSGIGGSHLRGPASLGLQGQSLADIPKEVFLETINQLMPLKWLPDAEDYGPLYAFLASRKSRVMTGTIVSADQGLMNRSVLSKK